MMMEIYSGDIPDFGMDDWEDLLTTETYPCLIPYGDWKRKGKVEVSLDEDYASADIPVWKFMFIVGERDEPVEFSEELEYWIKDLVKMRNVKDALRDTLRCWTQELDEAMGRVADSFYDEYDRALAKAFRMIVEELHALA